MEQNETWVDIYGHENYEISDKAQIRRKKNGKVLKQRKGTGNYNMITLWTGGKKYTRKVARLVWQSFNDCKCEHTIDHIDRNKDNDTIENLRCVTIEENYENRTIYKDKNKYNLDDEKRKVIISNIISGKWTTYRAWKETGIPTNYLDIVVKRGTWNKLLDEKNRVQ